jgi:Asp-tRNA(Asn)/Glu-tRNA(Gln) amidotransferase C subunit
MFACLPPVSVSDAEMARLARLSVLNIPRETLADAAEFERVRAGVSAVLTAARVLRNADAGANDVAPLEAALATLSDADVDAVAELRWSALRRDEVVSNTDDVVAFAASRDGPYFVAPCSTRDDSNSAP